MIKNLLVNRENFKVLVYCFYFGAQRESVWSEKTCCVCEIYIECVEVLYF